MFGDKLFDRMKAVTNGTYIRESSKEWKNLELELIRLKHTIIDKIDAQDPKYDVVFQAFTALCAAVDECNRGEGEASSTTEAAADTDAQIPNPENAEAAKPLEDGAGEGSDMTLESVLLEKDDKKKDDEPWSDARPHDEAVRQIVKDTWKELFVDNKFKGDKEPTREEVMAEIEFQSKHGLDHREDASAIRYDAYKKVMKKVKNIAKKLDAEDQTGPEEEDSEAKNKFQEASGFLGMKT